MSLFLRLALSSSFAAILAAQSSALVSVEELRNPLTKKALRALMTAREHLESGQRERGMQELRDALSDPTAMPFAISMLAVEHLRAGQLDTAIGELEQATQLLPGRPENHSNLAYSLYLKGQTERGLYEARKALQLDGEDPHGSRHAPVSARLSRSGSGTATPVSGPGGSRRPSGSRPALRSGWKGAGGREGTKRVRGQEHGPSGWQMISKGPSRHPML